MKVVYAKFYQGARVGGSVRTSLNGSELGFKEMHLVENLGLIINFEKNSEDTTTGRQFKSPETILVPFNNLAYCEVAQPEAEKDKKPKAV